jgi:sRNA-binding carbon storage regulator CsrA
MLVLSRQVGTSVMIGINCEIEVLVAGIVNNRVELSASWKTGGRISGEVLSGTFARDESLDLGGGAACTVLGIRDEKVRLGFIAPAEYQIHRRETWDALRRHNDDKTSDD